MKLKYNYSLLFCLLLSGCGGSSVAVQQPPVKHQVLVAQYGDSFAYGETLAPTGYQQSNPTEEQASQSAINDPLITITNHGDGGSEARGLLYSDTTGDIQFPITQPWAATLATEQAKVIIILFGWNDAAKYHRTTDEFMQAIDGLVQGVKAAGKIPVIETTSPADRSDLVGAETALVQSYVDAELAYGKANGVFVIDQWTYLNKQYGANWNTYISDGIHPTTEGYVIKGQYQASVIKPFLQGIE